MLPTIATGNVGSALAGEYEVANSLRFDGGSNDHLSKTPSSAGNRKTWTWSCWVKLGVFVNGTLFGVGTSSTEKTEIVMGGITNTAGLNVRIRSDTGDGNKAVTTSAVHRDPSAWYHIVVAVDTTQATDSNRIKIYVNGSQETSFSSSSYPSQNVDTYVNSTNEHKIGTDVGETKDFSGYMAEVCFIDGQALDPTSFGEFDSDTNIWKPIDVSGLTFGTNGFYLDFENSGSLGADVSGNGNNFTVNNLTSIDQSSDSCTNNFAVLNALDNYYPDSTLSEGNTQTVIGAGDWTPIKATFGLTTGKWYWEIKHSAVSSGSSYATIGIGSNQATGNQQRGGVNSTDYSYWFNGELRSNDSLQISVNSYGVGDIIGVALDLDNNNLYFSKNGTWQNSSDPESGATGTGAFSVTSPSSTPLGAYFPEVGFYDNTNTGTFQCNFGNPAFSISSGNSDGNGMGNFEYSVPSGYYSLNTKNLSEFG